MKKTLAECIEQYKFYSGKCGDAICNHEEKAIEFYTDKLFELVEYASYTYDVYLYDIDITDSI